MVQREVVFNLSDSLREVVSRSPVSVVPREVVQDANHARSSRTTVARAFVFPPARIFGACGLTEGHMYLTVQIFGAYSQKGVRTYLVYQILGAYGPEEIILLAEMKCTPPPPHCPSKFIRVAANNFLLEGREIQYCTTNSVLS